MIPLDKYKLPEPIITPIEYMTREQLITERGNELLFDIESYPNFFLIGFKSFVTGRVLFLEQSDWERMDLDVLRWITSNNTLVGFNSKNYDLPMLWAAFAGLNAGQLNAMSNAIILGGSPSWRLEKSFKFSQHKTDHIDLMQVAPAAAQFLGLKQYGGRMHIDKLQELPVEPTSDLTFEQSQVIRLYNVNDLDVTGWLLHTLRDPIELRKKMGKSYGVDLRSLSDAQIAEKAISAELEANTGVAAFVPKIPKGTTFRFKNQDYMRFFTPELHKLHQSILSTDFVIDEQGKVRVNIDGELKMATNLWKIKLGSTTYKLGIGGLHSSEQKISHFADDKTFLVDRDVESYYPAIILNQGLFPSHLGPAFLQTYGDIVKRRLKAKAAGDKSTSNSLKICINGCFGKLGSKWSVFYSPDLLVQVTLTGQLSLLMLIEMLEWSKIPVVSANTDGIVIKCPQERRDAYLAVVGDWERLTSFKTEETSYKSLHSRDVNNYIAIQNGAKFKAKGAYTNELSFKDKNRESLMTNPNGVIVSEAVMKFLATCRGPHPITLDSTILQCRDVRKFLFLRRVKGGAVKDGVYIGKVVRWYMKKGEFGCIRYKNANKAGIVTTVSETTGSHPLMDINGFPRDVDFDWYIRRGHSILKDLGFYGKDDQLMLF